MGGWGVCGSHAQVLAVRSVDKIALASAAAETAKRSGQNLVIAWLLVASSLLTLACSGPEDGAKENDSVAEVDSGAVTAETSTADLPGQGGTTPDDVTETACPVADVEVSEGLQVVPDTILHAKGWGSHSASGKPVAKHKWTVKQPPGSNQPLLPDANQPEVQLQAKAAGAYEFCLEVWDKGGWKSCTPACEQVLVIPGNPVHVELTWDTPKDADQTDFGPGAGADLDLLFAHPLANQPDQDCDGKADPWFDTPWTVSWFNQKPEWGAPGTGDNPSMELDDTNGAGPETVSLATGDGAATTPLAYSIGVYYSDDHGFGLSFATVRMFFAGSLAAEFSKVEMKAHDMWYVGKLNWPQGTGGEVVEPCHQSGLSCKAGKNLMWQSKGQWCITPCYKPPPGSDASPAKLPGAATCTTGP